MKRALKYWCICGFILWSTLSLYAQNQVQFKHINVDQGLSNGRVTSIVQDHLGFIWIGTKNGLNRYDGTAFKVYTKKNSKISSNDITSLKIDRKGKLWIGTIGGGVNIYNPIKDSFVNYQNNANDITTISSDDVHTIIEDSDANMWIGTANGLNLFLENSKAFKAYIYQVNNPLSLNHNSVWSVFQQTKDVFWIGTYGGGLNRFDKNTETFTRYNLDSDSDSENNTFSTEFINAISSTDENELLIGTNGNGLLKLNLTNNSVTNFFKNSKYEDVSIIRTLWEDKKRNLWVGTDGQGILKVNNKTLSQGSIDQYVNDSRLQTSIINNTVNTFFEDNQSNVWVGTAWKGLNVIEKKPNNIQFFYSDAKGYDASPVLSIFKNKNEIWMGTDGKGLSTYNLKSEQVQFYNKEHQSSLGGDFIQCIKQRENGQYWIGTFANGLVQIDSKKNIINQYKRDPNIEKSLPYNDVRSIIELPSNDLWVGTWGGGLSYFDSQKQTFTNFRYHKNDEKSISSDNVISVLLNEDGKLWIATYGGGLNFYDPKLGQFSSFQVDETKPNTIASNYVFSLLKDKQGCLWLGTKEGLSRFNPKTEEFTNFVVGTAVNNSAVVGLVQDNSGDIWMSTKEGIYKYNVVLKQIERFPESVREFHINSIYKDAEGMLYFGGIDGVTTLNPKLNNTYNEDPTIVFTDFKLFNKSIPVGYEKIIKNQMSYEDSIVLNFDQRVFTFNFTALQYPFSNKTQFAVKMEGFEEEWRDIGNQNTATFTNLSPGVYTFKVKSKMHSNLWNENKIAKIHINISPPLWRTWWAYILYFLILVFLLIAFQRYSINWAEMKNKLEIEKLHREQEDKLHNAKQRFFTNISHEIRTPLTLMLGSLNSLLKEDTTLLQQNPLFVIKDNTNRLLNLVNELLNFRKLETGHIELKLKESNVVEFVNEIYLTFSQHAAAKKIDYKFKKTKDNIPFWFDKNQLEKAIFNLLTNAFKFTKEGGEIKVEVFEEALNVNIIVSDTGKGIPKEKLTKIFERFFQKDDNDSEVKGFGIGLSIAKDIVELHGGTIEVKSKLNKGSEFSINIPFSNPKIEDLKYKERAVQDEEVVEAYVTTNPNVIEDAHVEDNNLEYTILIVEDNHQLRAFLQGLLSDTYTIIEAVNGKEGLEKTMEYVPDLVISDIMMPIMDGIALCEALKTDIRSSHIPVILLTARTLIADKMEGLETGADDYLTKPFNESILRIRVSNLLLNRKLLRDRFLKEGILRPKTIKLNSPDQEFLSKLVAIVEDNIEESEFNIDQLAKDIGMSHSNVYKKIKALTGMTIIGFVKDFRLQRAAQLLKEEHKISITDVCFKVGYTDRRHFSQEFKKKFGTSPSLYAKD